jgi:hypothetical protein
VDPASGKGGRGGGEGGVDNARGGAEGSAATQDGLFGEEHPRVILSYCALIGSNTWQVYDIYILGRGGLAVKYDTDSTTLGKDTKAWAGLCASTSFS